MKTTVKTLKPLDVERNFLRYVLSPVRFYNTEHKLCIRCYIVCHDFGDKKEYLLSKAKSYDLYPIFFDSLASLESYITGKGWW